ncbi:MAG: glycine zipper domain-containing protein [Ginsengibacter sp.]
MKNLLLALFVITAFAACKSNSDQKDQTRNIQLLSDSTAYNNNVFSDTNKVIKAEKIPAKITEKPRTIVIVKSPAKSPTKIATTSPVADQVTNIPTATNPPVVTTPEPAKPTVDNSASGTSTSQTASTGSETKVQKKKGLNKASQGAIIGGVGGAVGGAIISKKKGLGAVVGGIVGAAGGYIVGKNMDKKYNKFDFK